MGQCDRSHFQDSKRGGESFWDGLGVEFEAKQVLDARVCEWGFALWGVRGPGSARDGGTRGGTRTGGYPRGVNNPTSSLNMDFMLRELLFSLGKKQISCLNMEFAARQ